MTPPPVQREISNCINIVTVCLFWHHVGNLCYSKPIQWSLRFVLTTWGHNSSKHIVKKNVNGRINVWNHWLSRFRATCWNLTRQKRFLVPTRKLSEWCGCGLHCYFGCLLHLHVKKTKIMDTGQMWKRGSDRIWWIRNRKRENNDRNKTRTCHCNCKAQQQYPERIMQGHKSQNPQKHYISQRNIWKWNMNNT